MKRNDNTFTNYILIALICSGGFAPISMGTSLIFGAVIIIVLLLANSEQKTRKKEQLERFNKGDWWFTEREAFIAFQAAKAAQEREAKIERMLMETEIDFPSSQAALEEKTKTPAVDNELSIRTGGELHNPFLDERPRRRSDAETYFIIVLSALVIFAITVFLASLP